MYVLALLLLALQYTKFCTIVLFIDLLQTRSVTGDRRVVAVTQQPRHWSITVNSGRSGHGGYTTAEWGRRGVAAACAASSQMDVKPSRRVARRDIAYGARTLPLSSVNQRLSSGVPTRLKCGGAFNDDFKYTNYR